MNSSVSIPRSTGLVAAATLLLAAPDSAQTWPGSGADLRLLTGIETAPNANDVMLVQGGNQVRMRIDSPNGTFDNEIAILDVQAFVTGTPGGPGGTPGIPLLADFQLNMLTPAPFNIVYNTWVTTIEPGGSELEFAFPNHGAFGLSLLYQAGVISTNAPNGLIAFTDAHELRLLQARIYVDANLGHDGNPGTKGLPMRTLEMALQQAEQLAHLGGFPEIWLATGSYTWNSVLDDPISVHGGFDPTTWEKQADTYSIVSTSHQGVRLYGIDRPTSLTGLDIRAADAIPVGAFGPFSMNMASVGLDARFCSDALSIENCIVRSGDGSDGPAGQDASSDGSGGNAGSAGKNGYLTGIFTDPGPTGGSGGSGYFSGGKGGQGGDVYCSNFGPFGNCLLASADNGGNGSSGGGCSGLGGSGGSATICLSAANGADGAS